MLRKLGSYPRQSGPAVALRELGRIEHTLFALDRMRNIELRRRVQIGLNKGEAKNALARAVFVNWLGEMRPQFREPALPRQRIEPRSGGELPPICQGSEASSAVVHPAAMTEEPRREQCL